MESTEEFISTYDSSENTLGKFDEIKGLFNFLIHFDCFRLEYDQVLTCTKCNFIKTNSGEIILTEKYEKIKSIGCF